jgi:hypothetical protein
MDKRPGGRTMTAASGAMGSVIDRMQQLLEDMVDTDDELRHFHAIYLRTTSAVAAEIVRGGFQDPAWVEQWDVAFAELYLRALDQRTAGEHPPKPWAVAFAAADERRLPPLRQVLLALNAHINFDLPQALLAVVPDEDFGRPDVLAVRATDHEHLDVVLAGLVASEDRELGASERPGGRSRRERVLAPVSRLATRRFLRQSRRKVWLNASRLSSARQRGDEEFAGAIATLEELCAVRVADLMRPGLVAIRLGVRGFGVTLPAEATPSVPPPRTPPATV